MARRPIAVVSAYAPQQFGGGAERLAWEEARLLARAGRPVVFVHTSRRVDAEVEQVRIGGWLGALHDPATGARSPAAKLAFHALLLFNPATFVEALSAFRRLRPEVVHTHNLLALSPSVWLAARLAGARVVHTHHDLSLRCQRATMTRRDGSYCQERSAQCLLCRATRLVKLAQAPLLDREVFPSRWLRDRLGRRGPIVRPCAEGRPADRPPADFTALFLGRLVPAKGVEALIEAAREAGLTVVVAGDGPLADEVRAADGVTFAGYADDEDRARLLAGASVVVIPSIGPEGAPLVFFEALAAGVPVVLSDLAGLSELAEFGNAVLVPPGDAAALAEALRRLAADPARIEALRDAALDRRGDVSPERFRRELEAILDDVVR